MVDWWAQVGELEFADFGDIRSSLAKEGFAHPHCDSHCTLADTRRIANSEIGTELATQSIIVSGQLVADCAHVRLKEAAGQPRSRRSPPVPATREVVTRPPFCALARTRVHSDIRDVFLARRP